MPAKARFFHAFAFFVSLMHRGLGAVLSAVIFVVIFAVSLLAHGDLAVTRSVVSRGTTRALASLFAGEIRLGRVQQVGFRGVDIERVDIVDPLGRPVIVAKGLVAKISVLDLVKNLFDTSSELLIPISSVSIDDAEVVLDHMPDSDRLAIEQTFAPRTVTPKVVGELPAPRGRAVRVDLPTVNIRRAWAHGSITDTFHIDAVLQRVPARVEAGSEGVFVDIDSTPVTTVMLAPLSPEGTIEYHLKIPDLASPRPDMSARFSGELGDLPVQIEATMVGKELKANLTAPKATPEQVHSLLPAVPLRSDVSISATAEGPIPELVLTGRVVSGPTELFAQAIAHVATPVRIDSAVRITDLDPRLFIENVAPASISGNGTVLVQLPEDKPPEISATLSTITTTYDGVFIPALQAEAKWEDDRLSGRVLAAEPGAPIDARFQVAGDGTVDATADAIALDLSQVFHLQGAIHGRAHAHATLHRTPSGMLDIISDIDGSDIAVGPFKAGEARVRCRLVGNDDDLDIVLTSSADNTSLASLPIQHIDLDAKGDLLSPHLSVRAKDTALPTVTIDSDVWLKGSPRATNLQARVEEGDVNALLKVETIRFDSEREHVSLDGVKLEGTAGTLEGKLGIEPGALDVELRGDLNLGKLPGATRALPFERGLARVVVALHTGRGTDHGTATINFDDAKLRAQKVTFAGALAVGIVGHEVTASLQGLTMGRPAQKPIVAMNASINGRLDGPLLEIRSWERLTGSAALSDADISFDRMNDPKIDPRPVAETNPEAAPNASIPTSTADTAASPTPPVEDNDPWLQLLPGVLGHAMANSDIKRDHCDGWPAIRLEIEADHAGIKITGGDTVRIADGDAISIRSSLGPEATSQGSSSAKIEVIHRRGMSEVVHARVLTSFEPSIAATPLLTLMKAPSALKRAEAIEQLLGFPVSGDLVINPFKIEELPSQLRPEMLAGTVSGLATVSGKLGRPELVAKVKGEKLTLLDGGVSSREFDAEITSALGGNHLETQADLGLNGTVLARVGASTRIEVPSILRGAAHPTWVSSASLVMMNGGLPLEVIPQLASLRTNGKLQGWLVAYGLHAKPEIRGDLAIVPSQGESFELMGIPAQSANIHVQLAEEEVSPMAGFGEEEPEPSEHGGRSTLKVTMVQAPQSQKARAEGRNGTLVADARFDVLFADQLIPWLAPGVRQRANITLSGFDIGPVLEDSENFADLGGSFDGSVAFEYNPGRRGDDAFDVKGKLDWSQGEFSVPVVGQSFKDGSVHVDVKSGDHNISISATRLQLAATAGSVIGEAKMFVPMSLLRRAFLSATLASTPKNDEQTIEPIVGSAELRVLEDRSIPVTFEGVPLGSASGTVGLFLRYSPQTSVMRIDVGIPQLVFDLPEGTTRDVQELAPNPDVGVVNGRALDLQQKRTKTLDVSVCVGLGFPLIDVTQNANCRIASATQRPSERTQVLVRRSGVDVQLRGMAELRLREKATLTGEVNVTTGRINALGKPFEVESGQVVFEGDEPANPFVQARARWDTNDGVRVYVEALGRLKLLKIRFRSEPARPESEVAALVLFGRDLSAQSGPGADSGNGVNSSLAVGGGVASTVLNSLLDPVQVFGRRIETRVDTSSSHDTRLGVATEIRPNLWAQVDVSTTSQQNRVLTNDTTSITLDWRFRRAWSLKTSLGDRGSTSVDLVWQYRY